MCTVSCVAIPSGKSVACRNPGQLPHCHKYAMCASHGYNRHSRHFAKSLEAGPIFYEPLVRGSCLFDIFVIRVKDKGQAKELLQAGRLRWRYESLWDRCVPFLCPLRYWGGSFSIPRGSPSFSSSIALYVSTWKQSMSNELTLPSMALPPLIAANMSFGAVYFLSL